MSSNGTPTNTSIQPLADMSVDILRIEPELVQIVDQSKDYEQMLTSLLAYLRSLTNARASLLVDTDLSRPTPESWQVWTPDTNNQQSALLGDIRGVLRGVSGKGQALIEPLPSQTDNYLVATPFSLPGAAGRYLCLILVARDPRQLEPFIIILQTITGFFHYAYDRSKNRGGDWAFDQASALVELGTVSSEAEDFPQAARILTDRLQRHLGCFRVCLGLAKRNEVRLIAISGVSSFDHKGTSAFVLQAAMREAFQKKEMIEWPKDDERIDLTEVAHQELQRLLDLQRVITLPFFKANGKPFAAISMLWDHNAAPRPETRRFLSASREYLGSLLGVLKGSEPPPPVRWWNKTWGKWSQNRRKLAMYVAGGLILLLAWPFPHHIRVPCKIQPVVKRIIAAPFDGQLQKSMVEPGEIVERGRVLAVLDERELRLKQAELQAARDRALKMRDRSMTDEDSDYALSQVAQFEAEGHEQELRLVDWKIENLEIKTPLDGVVLSGDLKRAEGIPVNKGQILFEVAPLEKIVVEMEIPDYNIANVKEDMEVNVKIEAFAGETWAARIRKINPQSEVKEGKNSFLAEAPLPASADVSKLRPGMKGKAVIIGERKPLFWILTHRLWDFIRITLFW